VDKLLLTREMFGQAYELAVFIHGDEEIAIRIVAGAASKLEVAITAQSKRLYYKPNRSGLSRTSRSIGFRHKILLCDSHLLQRLVYIESEPHEKAREQGAAGLDQKEMVRYFIKHLVRITLRRNSFYVALGVSRLLHSYNTAETMQIYNVVVQDPERVKDDYYYRSRKGVLMNELKDRFGDLLRTYRGPHGEERFQSSNHTHECVLLVKQCLAFFTPWATPCLIPDVFDPITGEISRFVTRDPRDEDRTEVDRIHALTHPDCFNRLIRALGFDSPEERLALPLFFLNQNGQDRGPHSSNQDHPKLDEETLKAIEDEIADQAPRRKRFTNGLVRVIVDGVEQVSWQTNRARNSAEIAIGNNAELVELKASDAQGDLLLATHLIRRDDAAHFRKPLRHKIVLEGGQEVSISLRYPSPDDLAGCIMVVTYKERASVAATLSSFGGLLEGLFDLPVQARRRVAVSLIALTVACLVFTLFWLKPFTAQRNRVETAPPTSVSEASPGKPGVPAVTNQSKSVVAQESSASSSTLRSPAAVQTVKKTDKHRTQARLPEVSRRDGEAREGSSGERRSQRTAEARVVERRSESEPTRDLTVGPSVVPLRHVKKIFLEPLENQALNQEIGVQLLDHLRATGTLILVQSAEEADAVLKLYPQTKPTSKADPKSVTVSALLVNVTGDVVWPRRQRRKGTVYSGLPAEVAGRIAADLLRDIQKSQ